MTDLPFEVKKKQLSKKCGEVGTQGFPGLPRGSNFQNLHKFIASSMIQRFWVYSSPKINFLRHKFQIIFLRYLPSHFFWSTKINLAEQKLAEHTQIDFETMFGSYRYHLSAMATF